MKNYLKRLLGKKEAKPQNDYKVTTLSSIRTITAGEKVFKGVYYDHMRTSICNAVKELITFEEHLNEEEGTITIKAKIDIIYVEDSN